MGQTCLHIASQNGNLEVVKLLLEKGVDVNAYDGEGYLLESELLNLDTKSIETYGRSEFSVPTRPV